MLKIRDEFVVFAESHRTHPADNSVENTTKLTLITDKSKITQAEEKMGRKFPQPLVALWTEFGYGWVNESMTGAKGENLNEIMTPDEITPYFTDGPRKYNIDVDIKGSIPFFHVHNEFFISILPDGRIVYLEIDTAVLIANDMNEFIETVVNDPEFFSNISYSDDRNLFTYVGVFDQEY